MTLHEKYASSVIHALSGGSTAASNRAVDLLGGFFFIEFDVPGSVGADEDVVHLNLSTPVHPRTGPAIGHKNTRQVTPWGVLPGGRNLPRFFLWIGTDYHRRTPYGMDSGRLGDRGDAGNRTPVRCGFDGASPCAVYANATFRLRYLHKHIYRRT